MTTQTVSQAGDTLVLRWPDGGATPFPTIWLRDNCPSGLHPQTGERTFDLLSVPETPQIAKSAIVAGALHVQWADGHESRFDLDWLAAHRPGRHADDPAAIAPVPWRAAEGAAAIPRHAADAILGDDAALAAWLRDTARHGLSIVEGVAGRPEASIALAERVGFLRQTNFGRTFEVMSKPDPNNLAYTSHALPLHTDLPNQEVPPGYQFLHCIANAATGGGSIFADGFAIAEDLARDAPEAWRLLAEVPIPFRFHDADTDIRVHQPVICRDAFGAVSEIRFNAHIASVFDMPAETLAAYYPAYRRFMAMTRDPAYRATLRLAAGEMVVFDNRRVLHGREAFDPATGFRHLHGCYVDRGEFASKLRALARAGV